MLQVLEQMLLWERCVYESPLQRCKELLFLKARVWDGHYVRGNPINHWAWKRLEIRTIEDASRRDVWKKLQLHTNEDKWQAEEVRYPSLSARMLLRWLEQRATKAPLGP